jgi:hypothetical protein
LSRLRLPYLLLALLCLSVDPSGGESRGETALRDTALTVRSGDSLSRIATRFLSASPSYTHGELMAEILRYNGLTSNMLQPDQQLLIPLRAELPNNRSQARSAEFEARGIYVNARTAGSSRVQELVDRFTAVGGNALVFDVKDRQGNLSYTSRVPLAIAIDAGGEGAIQQPAKLIELLHQRQIHSIARLTCFYDARLAARRPDLVPFSRTNGGMWTEKGSPSWVDPSLPEVQTYLLDLLAEVAAMGVDEIQLDYVRFPTEGDREDAVYAFDPELLPKHRIISDFLAKAAQLLEPTGVLLSADIFGVVAWGRTPDVMSTGQKIEEMMPHLDVVSPMLYPSHFYGAFNRIENPVDCPYYFVYEGCRQLRQLAAAHGVAIRPWVQAFDYRVRDFDEEYIARQLQGAEDAGALGWLLWNPASRYEEGMKAVARFHDANGDSALRQADGCPAPEMELPEEAATPCCSGELGAAFPVDE